MKKTKSKKSEKLAAIKPFDKRPATVIERGRKRLARLERMSKQSLIAVIVLVQNGFPLDNALTITEKAK